MVSSQNVISLDSKQTLVLSQEILREEYSMCAQFIVLNFRASVLAGGDINFDFSQFSRTGLSMADFFTARLLANGSKNSVEVLKGIYKRLLEKGIYVPDFCFHNNKVAFVEYDLFKTPLEVIEKFCHYLLISQCRYFSENLEIIQEKLLTPLTS